MRALSALFLLMIFILTSSCGDKAQTDGDTITDGDEEFSSDNASDGDSQGSDNSIDSPEAFYAPMLSDPAALEVLFGDSMSSNNINYGETLEGQFDGILPFVPFTLDAIKGAKLTIGVVLEDNLVNPAIILYGPRSKNGLWGEEIALAYRSNNETSASISDFPINTNGTYLILVGLYDAETSAGRFTISLGCRNQCTEPACPDITCQGYCENDYLTDASGCLTCHCSTVEDDCDPNVEDCYPVTGSCDCEAIYSPVCGEDGTTYANECEAECFGVTVNQIGECKSAIDNSCSTDSDCSENQRCINGLCEDESKCDCSEDIDPVCGVDGKTYNNICELECAEIEILDIGDCEDVYSCKPYCGSVEANSAWRDSCTEAIISIKDCSGCIATCKTDINGVEGWFSSCDKTLIKQEDCMDGCGCLDFWYPVCGQDGQTYTNECYASCDDVKVAYEGECNDSMVGCSSNADCLPSQICTFNENCTEVDFNETEDCYGYCTTSPDLVQCTTDSDCLEGEICTADQTSNSSFCLPATDSTCIISGCHNEICSTSTQNTDCTWQTEYSCYPLANCVLTTAKNCEWVGIDEEYDQCIDNINSSNTCTADIDCLSGMFCDNGICSEADCICPDNNNPVCGVNGQTYPNLCELNCDQIHLAHEGGC